jgi:hypothetical protein
MANVTYDNDITGLVVIDPYNDFISEGGKVWDRLKGVAEANQCVPHMRQVLDAARAAGVRVFYALHRRYRRGDYRRGSMSRPFRKPHGRARPSNTEPGVASSTQSLSPSRVTSLPKNTGVQAVSPTPTWTYC